MLQSTVTSSSRPDDFMSKKLVAFCLFSIGFTVWLLFGAPPPNTLNIPDIEADQQQQSIYKGRHAISTFLTSKADEAETEIDNDDGNFVSTRILVYQLLHSPSTKLRDPVPIIVLVTPEVREAKRHRLREDGAIVIEVDHATHSMPVTPSRWSEMATKLRLFDPTVIPYETVLFLEADIVLTRPIDRIFLDPSTEPAETDKTIIDNSELGKPPAKFVMAASAESFQREHEYPFLDREKTVRHFNGGVFIYSPSSELFQFYTNLLNLPELYYMGVPDQDLLNHAHRWGGPMPWRRLHWSWYINWSNDNDLNGKMALLNAKWWGSGMRTPAVEQFALARRWEMEGFWMGKAHSSSSGE
ncbi:hypothetical protein N7481_004312 [Penicillium waksmanii]|uniref:uncharacterized protein n=1 Tax=Penicillium waksmanii TaxID=69791 RepID=UPI002548FAE9|nr:uncharacterized protein N7481_004312 [Penicillium waksmanii]KAJ5989102.1 hypothetical protein N7481_004312 [Penicillium waksmanii]